MAGNSVIEDLLKRAQQGAPRAQYELAAALSAAGHASEADKWLRSAADLGEADALYTLATRQLQTRATAGKAAELLERAAEGNSAAAMRLLAVLTAEGLNGTKDWAKAAKFVVSAAKAGDPAARREIAMVLLANDPDDLTACLLINQAATTDAVAAAVMVRRAALGRAGANKAAAAGMLDKLQAARYPGAPALQSALQAATTPAPDHTSTDNMTIDWEAIGARIAGPPVCASPPVEILSTSPDAKTYRAAFTPEECEYVIAASARLLTPSMTVDPRDGALRRDAYRTSMTATLGPVDLDLPLIMINGRLAALAGEPVEHAEFLSVLNYAPGQEYRPHFDWLPEGPDFDRGGQRIATALLYLNGDYEGGETRFVDKDLNFCGEPGDVLVFRNVLPDGAPDKASRHASLPVTNGAKWIVSKWFRARKYVF